MHTVGQISRQNQTFEYRLSAVIVIIWICLHWTLLVKYLLSIVFDYEMAFMLIYIACVLLQPGTAPYLPKNISIVLKAWDPAPEYYVQPEFPNLRLDV